MMDGSRPTLDDLVAEREAEAPAVQRENPKEAMSKGKRPDYSAIPETILVLLAAVFECGAIKYGRFNWRKDPIKLSAYKRAATGHQQSAYAGDWFDDETRLQHLMHSIATQAIMVDAEIHGTLIHDLHQQEGVFRRVHEDAAEKVAAFAVAWQAKAAAGDQAKAA